MSEKFEEFEEIRKEIIKEVERRVPNDLLLCLLILIVVSFDPETDAHHVEKFKVLIDENIHKYHGYNLRLAKLIRKFFFSFDTVKVSNSSEYIV